VRSRAHAAQALIIGTISQPGSIRYRPCHDGIRPAPHTYPVHQSSVSRTPHHINQSINESNQLVSQLIMVNVPPRFSLTLFS
jgi:hypothetical protein